MAQQMVRKTSSSDLTALQESVRKDFVVILEKLEAKLQEAPKLFPSGIELIKLTLKAGTNLEFSVIVAGKDAPKDVGKTSVSESGGSGPTTAQ